jgi:4-hydroxybenzoate polyprenyltransferase/phosphoserine phosphatase
MISGFQPSPSIPAAPGTTRIPLVVDLDGTLLRSDLLVESALGFARLHLTQTYRLPGWLLQGKARLKAKLAHATMVDVASLPYNEEVLRFLRTAQDAGQPLILATATHRHLAEQVANHLGCFDRVLATEDTVNLAGPAKRDALVREFGVGGFDYVGDSAADLAVWASARRGWTVNASAAVERAARALPGHAGAIPTPRSKPADWLRALRLHQWLKNLLVFVPLLGAHQLGNLPLLVQSAVAFLAFGLCASSVYLLNDLLDLPDDRRHARKRHRPFAAGRIPIAAGVVAKPLLLVAAFGLSATLLAPAATAVLGFYYLVTLAYSLSLKRRMAIDVIALAGLYTLRIVMGAVATGLTLSFWLMAFSMFIFLSLALVKRYAELFHARQTGKSSRTPGRGYFPEDLAMIAPLGAASGYLAVLVMALYINDAHTLDLYRRPEVIWLACPLVLSWITRVWMLTHRGEMHEDPLVFATKDWKSLTTGVLFAATLILAK